MLPKINSQIDSDVINGLQRHYYKLIFHSMKMNNDEALHEVFKSLLIKLSSSVEENSTAVFSQFIYIPTWIYIDCTKQFQSFKVYVRDLFEEYFHLLLRISIGSKQAKDSSIQEKERYNVFTYLSFCGYLSLIHSMVFCKEVNDIEHTLEEFRKLYEDYERSSIQERMKMNALVKEGNSEEIDKLQRSMQVEYYPVILHGQSSLALQAWFWYLFKLGELNDKLLLKYTSALRLRYYKVEDLILDTVQISNESHYGYLGIGQWDYTERGEEVYSPPQAHEWIVFGMVVYVLSY
jgi:hypothetical protein